MVSLLSTYHCGFDWHIKMPNPVLAGDRLRLEIEIRSKRPSNKQTDRGYVTTAQRFLNQDGKAVFICEVVWIIATKGFQLGPAGGEADSSCYCKRIAAKDLRLRKRSAREGTRDQEAGLIGALIISVREPKAALITRPRSVF